MGRDERRRDATRLESTLFALTMGIRRRGVSPFSIVDGTRINTDITDFGFGSEASKYSYTAFQK